MSTSNTPPARKRFATPPPAVAAKVARKTVTRPTPSTAKTPVTPPAVKPIKKAAPPQVAPITPAASTASAPTPSPRPVAKKASRNAAPPPAPKAATLADAPPSRSARAPAPAKKSAAKKATQRMAAPPTSALAHLNKKREAVQAEHERAEQAAREGPKQVEGTKFNQRLPDEYVPSTPAEAMFYLVFGAQEDGEFVDNMPFLLANRAMPSPKG